MGLLGLSGAFLEVDSTSLELLSGPELMERVIPSQQDHQRHPHLVATDEVEDGGQSHGQHGQGEADEVEVLLPIEDGLGSPQGEALVARVEEPQGVAEDVDCDDGSE